MAMKKLLLTSIAALSLFASAAMAQFPRAGVIVLQDQLGGIIPLHKRLLKCLRQPATISKFVVSVHRAFRSLYQIYRKKRFALPKRLCSGFINIHRWLVALSPRRL